jgi:uncharacterized protein YbaR (Trm112 family)
MTAQRPGMPGATRICPHCKETILESAAVCPVCRHHLRFEPAASSAAPATTTESFTPLRVEGSLRNPAGGEAWEYTMVLTIRNERGEDIARKIVGVGAMQPEEQRTFSLSVELGPAADKPTGKRGTRH